MIKQKALFIIFLLVLSTPTFASDIRLFSMGDMQGVIEDESDYNRDVTFIPAIRNSRVSNVFTDNHFDQRFPGNDCILAPWALQDYTRQGRSTTNNYDMLIKVDRSSGFAFQYEEQNRDYISHYYDATSAPQTIKRYGYTTKSTIAYGSALSSWFAYGLGYENLAMSDKYVGTVTSLSGTNCREDGTVNGAFIGARFGDISRYFSVGYGGGYGDLVSKDDTGELFYQKIYAPSRSHAAVSYRMPDNIITFKAMAYSSVYPTDNNVKSIVGMQIRPVQGMIFGIATSSQYCGQYIIYRRHIGFEQKLTDFFTWRLGAVDKSINYDISQYQRRFFSDSMAGFELRIFSNLSIEGAYMNYTDVYGPTETWSSIPHVVQTSAYSFSNTESRNELFLGGIKYTF
jgi:hypothetical protein